MSSLQTAEKSQEEMQKDIDPNVRQRSASDPNCSVWVGASAGTGKTKVLTDRVLRLLLPRKDGAPGTLPHRIFCLTFTKAAASEMAMRINRTLSSWAVKDETALRSDLKNLIGYEPSSVELDAARQLFARVVDTPGGFKIMTIHAFCQSVLARFPLEAGIAPQFTVLDEARAQEMLTRARDTVLQQVRDDGDTELNASLSRLAAVLNEDQFSRQLTSLVSENLQLEKLGFHDGLYNAIVSDLGLQAGDTEEKILERACSEDCFNASALWRACKILGQSSKKTDIGKAATIQLWLESSAGQRAERFDDYAGAFIAKSTGTISKKLATKSLTDNYPEIVDALEEEAARVLAVTDAVKAVRCARLSYDLLTLGQTIIEKYNEMKARLAVLDYDDLILKTRALLKREGIAPWILFKLDGGLDHILIDEAQDTNPEQWEIITCLCTDFYAGEGRHQSGARTVFTVGDKKQSIYSFQRASPGEFERMRVYFQQKAEQSGAVWREESLNISFRSAKSILELVDDVFSHPETQKGLGRDMDAHISYRTQVNGDAGLCEIWPLFEPEEDEDVPPWSPPVEKVEKQSPHSRLAESISVQIKHWLENGEVLESKGRPIHAGDILVLVRTRTSFVNLLVRALKSRDIPVSGLDRMVLNDALAVQDLTAAARFALLPSDDLSLACLLKSPLVGWDDEMLYTYAADRDCALWQKIRDKAPEAVITWLEQVIADAGLVRPYEFFSKLLQTPCPANRESGMQGMLTRLGEDIRDPLDEFLNRTLLFESDNIGSLQQFLIWQQQGQFEVKREMEETRHAVRIMTVHGAKGLQAPVVFLPDTVRNSASKRIPRLLWPDNTGVAAPLFCPRQTEEPQRYSRAKAALEEQLDEEYSRLLYVAMTRAEDRLYIAGAAGKRKGKAASWYNYIQKGFDSRSDVSEIALPDGRTARRIYNPQTKKPGDSHTGAEQDEIVPKTSPPSWMYETAPQDKEPPRPLIPSRPAAPISPPAASPLARADQYRFRRGNITHKLLQYLPAAGPGNRKEIAMEFVSKSGRDLPEDIREDIVRETLAILDNPAYSDLFGADSRAEVPITGMAGKELISGQIDRLYVGEDKVMIIDYKTNRPSPENEGDVPEIYRQQMRAYRDTIREIYPSKHIFCYLLWTDVPNLMHLSALDQVAA